MEQKREVKILAAPGYKKGRLEKNYPFLFHDRSSTLAIGTALHSHKNLAKWLKEAGIKGRAPLLGAVITEAGGVEPPGMVVIAGVRPETRGSLALACKALEAEGFGKAALWASKTRKGSERKYGTVSQIARRKFK